MGRPAVGEVGGVVEEGGGDLAARSHDVRLADHAGRAIDIGDDLDGGHRARFRARRPAWRRPMSLASGSSGVDELVEDAQSAQHLSDAVEADIGVA